jgi:phosphatidylethanolamine N-methyltransferase
LYGQKLREVSGVSKTVRQALPSPVRDWQSAADDYLNSTFEYIEDFLDHARPKLAAGVENIVKDTTALFKTHTTRISVTRLPRDFDGLDSKQYKIEIEGTPSAPTVELQKNGGREGEMARTPATRTSEFKTLILEYGAPVKVRWQAPLNHSKRDWIGLYMVTDNQSREVTRISSNGRWVATNKGVWDSTRAEEGILVADSLLSATSRDDGPDCYTGEVEFRGDKLWWTTGEYISISYPSLNITLTPLSPGVFEFRYHHGGKHHVMAVSQAFEIRIPRFDEDDVEVDASGTMQRAAELALVPVIQNCFDHDPEIAPSSPEESFGSLVERDGKFAKRVVFAVHQM